MEILARGVGRRKEAIAQVQIVKGTGQFLINNTPAQDYLHNNTCSILSVKAPLSLLKDTSLSSKMASNDPSQGDGQGPKAEETSGGKFNFDAMDTIVKVKGGGLVGQAEAIKLGLARALCEMVDSSSSTASSTTNIDKVAEEVRKSLKDKGYLTQDSRVKERRKYGLKKARKASQYHKR
jgi:small subunit ribosomal protein S9